MCNIYDFKKTFNFNFELFYWEQKENVFGKLDQIIKLEGF